MKRDDALRRVARLRQRLDGDLESLASLRAVQDLELEFEDLLTDLDRQLERASDAAVLVLVGSTGAGKSTLLNALAGAPVAESSTTRPTTSVPTVYAPRDADLRSLLSGLLLEPKVVRFDPGDDARLGDQVLIDAPDTNSVATEHRATVRALAERADVLIVVEHRQSVVEDSTVEFLDEFTGRRDWVFVLNRADELTEDARDQLREQLARVAHERLGLDAAPTVHAISAAQAGEGRGGPAFERLLEAIEGYVAEGRLAGVRRHNALGVASAIGELAARARESAGPALVEIPTTTRDGMQELLGAVQQEVDSRLTLKRPEVAAALASEAGRRWDGPGGWALRSGAWSTLGAGVGLALARRNPALAAGAALGGTVVGRARNESGRRRLEDASTLLPEPDAIAGLHSQHLGQARIAAGRLTLDPDALGVPTLESLERGLVRAVEDAWSRLLNRRLPETAERCAPAVLRWSLDLPVYALSGTVLYRAAVGFWTGEYVGLDFLINGLLLAIALAFLVRMLIRSILAARAKGLLRRVAEDIGSALEASGESSTAPLREECARLSGELDRLAGLESRWRDELERRRAT